jgi:hypothetical protein
LEDWDADGNAESGRARRPTYAERKAERRWMTWKAKAFLYIDRQDADRNAESGRARRPTYAKTRLTEA